MGIAARLVPVELEVTHERITNQHSTAGRAPSRVGITRTVPPGRSVAVRGYPASSGARIEGPWRQAGIRHCLMHGDECGGASARSADRSPAGTNHGDMKSTDGMQLQVIPQIPFEVFDRLLPSLSGHPVAFNLPFDSGTACGVRVATEMHVEIAARRVAAEAETETSGSFPFR